MDRACRSRPLRLNVRLVIGERFGGLVPSPERARLHPDSYLVFVSRTITARSQHVTGIRKAGKRYIGQCREVFYHLPAQWFVKGICGVGGEGDATKYMLRCGCEADTVFSVVYKDIAEFKDR